MSKKPGKRTLVSVIAAVLIVAAGIAGYMLYRKPASAATTAPTVEVRRGTLTETAAASGKIEPHVQVEVKSRASGEVIEILVKEGDRVEAGQLLVRLDKTDTQRSLDAAKVALKRAKADLASAQASVNVAALEQKNSQTTQEIAEKGVELGVGTNDAARTAAHAAKVAGANVSLRRAQVSASQAALETAEVAVREAETRLKETDIFAPMSGTVLSIAVEKGTIVASALTNVNGGTALMTLADLSDLRIVGSIDEAQISRVAPEQKVDIRVDAYPERVFKGVVDRVSPLGVETSSVVTFDVEIRIVDEKASLLRSGMSADVEILTAERKDVLLVPLAAVQSKNRRRVVTLANGEERPIKTGATDGAQMIVLEGLEEGERILASAPVVIPEGAPAQGQGQRGGNPSMRGMGMGMGGPPRGGR